MCERHLALVTVRHSYLLYFFSPPSLLPSPIMFFFLRLLLSCFLLNLILGFPYIFCFVFQYMCFLLLICFSTNVFSSLLPCARSFSFLPSLFTVFAFTFLLHIMSLLLSLNFLPFILYFFSLLTVVGVLGFVFTSFLLNASIFLPPPTHHHHCESITHSLLVNIRWRSL